jgi:hypothetical protein
MTITAKIKNNKGNITVLPFGKAPNLNEEYAYNITIEKRLSGRSFKQNATYWALVSLFWYTQNEGEISEYEKRLESFNILLKYGKTMAVGGGRAPVTDIKLYTKDEMTSILSLMFCELASMSDKPYFVAQNASTAFIDFQEYLSGLEHDCNDYYPDYGFPLKEAEEEYWRQIHPVSQASGQGGVLHLHHIHSRKARPDLKDRSWNWLMLTAQEHSELHNDGQRAFIKKYPHLRGRFARADKLA